MTSFKLSKRSSSFVLGMFGIGTYLLISTVVMLKSKGELNGITLVMSRGLEEKKLQADVDKERKKSIS
jgi:hypothetical protein